MNTKLQAPAGSVFRKHTPPRQVIIAFAAALLCSLLLFKPLLGSKFIAYDDPDYITNNPHVSNPDYRLLFHPDTAILFDWQPLTILSYHLDYRIAGFEPGFFHISSLFWHFLTTLLLVVLLRVLGMGLPGACFAALLFFIHPLNAETVGWLSARKNILAALFGLGFTIAALKHHWLKAGLLLLCALASKGEAVFLPLWPLAIWLLRKSARPQNLSRSIIAYFAFFALSATRTLISLNMQLGSVQHKPSIVHTLWERLEISCRVFVFQLYQFVSGAKLSFYYTYQPQSWLNLWFLGSTVVCLSIAVLIWQTRTRFPLISVLLLLTVTAYLPVANIFPAPYYQADRYMYFRMLPLCGLVGLLFENCSQIKSGKLLSALLCIWVLLLGGTLHSSLKRFKDTETLWRSVIDSEPNYYFAWHQLAVLYAKAEKHAEAEFAFRNTLLLNPSDDSARRNLVLLLKKQGKTQQAKEELQRWLDSTQDHPTALGMLAGLYLDQGENSKAAPLIERLKAQQPGNPAVLRLEQRLIKQPRDR